MKEQASFIGLEWRVASPAEIARQPRPSRKSRHENGFCDQKATAFGSTFFATMRLGSRPRKASTRNGNPGYTNHINLQSWR